MDSCNALLESALLGLALLASGCLQATPFGAGVDDEDRDTIAENLARLRRRNAPEPLRIAAFGDTHGSIDDLARVVDILNARDDLGFVVITGDLTDNGRLFEYELTKHELDRLRVPYFPTIGNHDALSHGKEIWTQMFGPFDYAFGYRGVRFILPNTNVFEFGPSVPDEAWVHGQLADLEPETRVVFVAHYPPVHDEGYPGDDGGAFFGEVLAQYPIELFAHGHVAPWDLRRLHEELVLSTSTFDGGNYTLVTFLQERLAFERCAMDHCVPVALPPVAPPADDPGQVPP